MKTYKLIKEYPDSAKLGTVVTVTDKETDRVKYFTSFPEFWEEQKPKGYEILSFICNRNIGELSKGCVVKKNHTRFEGYTKNNPTIISSNEERFLASENWDIHSIKRLSDGEVFTISDRIRYQNLFSTFNIKFIILLQSGQIVLKDHYNQIGLESAAKVKIPLFKTEDGVEIFDENTFVAEVFTQVYSMNSPILFKHTNICLKETKYPTLIFATEKAAKNYIKLNKPCLSYSDVMEIFKVGQLAKDVYISASSTCEKVASIKAMKTNLNHLIKTRVDGKK